MFTQAKGRQRKLKAQQAEKLEEEKYRQWNEDHEREFGSIVEAFFV